MFHRTSLPAPPVTSMWVPPVRWMKVSLPAAEIDRQVAVAAVLHRVIAVAQVDDAGLGDLGADRHGRRVVQIDHVVVAGADLELALGDVVVCRRMLS